MVITADANTITYGTATIPTRSVFLLDYDPLKIYLYHTDQQVSRSEPTTLIYDEITSYNGGAKPSLSDMISELRGYMASSAAPPRTVECKIIPDTMVLAVLNGLVTLTIPYELNQYRLVRAEAGVSTVSSSGKPTIQVKNLTTNHDMLSTAVTIDAGEKNSYTASVPHVVNSTYNLVSTGDEVKIYTTSAGNGAMGLNVILTFRLL